MAWIACHCQCGCRKHNFCDPPRSSRTSPGLCRACKAKGHSMIRHRMIGEIIEPNVRMRSVRKQLIVGVSRVVSR